MMQVDQLQVPYFLAYKAWQHVRLLFWQPPSEKEKTSTFSHHHTVSHYVQKKCASK